MEVHLLSTAPSLSQARANRNTGFLAALFALSILFFNSHSAAQTRMAGNSASRGEFAATLPGIKDVPSVQMEPEISAPVPNMEVSSLTNQAGAVSFQALAAQNSSQSSSQSASQDSTAGSSSSTTSAKTATTKSKPPHHALGVTLAVIGTTTFAAGVVLLAGEHAISVCNGASKGCNEARDAGLVMTPVGGAVAITGFYLQFHR